MTEIGNSEIGNQYGVTDVSGDTSNLELFKAEERELIEFFEPTGAFVKDLKAQKHKINPYAVFITPPAADGFKGYGDGEGGSPAGQKVVDESKKAYDPGVVSWGHTHGRERQPLPTVTWRNK